MCKPLPQPIGKLTAKDTGNEYDLYEHAGMTGTYTLYVRKGLCCHCTCPSRQYRKGKQCKHMKDCQAMLDQVEQERQAIAATPVATVRRADLAPLSSNRPFSLMA